MTYASCSPNWASEWAFATNATTSGRFRLNVSLPIPFGGFGTLEVDLLQESGYFVLRFLAEDVGKELDAVLDAVLRVTARRRQSPNRAEPLEFVRQGRG